MRIGLYGKLPAKRDFIAVSTSREFLLVWEAWLQGGLSACAVQLGDGWKAAFVTAPIWRFWLGAEICGETTLGAFMPSIDGVGRYFPLTVLAAADGQSLPPPEFEPQAAWFAAAEDLLLSALDDATGFDDSVAALGALPPPRSEVPPFARREAAALPDGTLLIEAGREPFPDLFAATRMVDHGSAYAAMSFWWTVGGEGFPALALSRRRMPDPFVFTGLLTGDFGASRS